MSPNQKKYLLVYKRKKVLILLWQLAIVGIFLLLWQIMSDKNVINPFIFSSPTRVISIIWELIQNNNLFNHIWVTLYETLLAFLISVGISLFLAILLYLFEPFYKICDPFLTCLNSLPKVALGPMIIIVFGANTNSIIAMAVLINVIVSTLVITGGFYETDGVRVKLMKSFKANRFQLLWYLVIPHSYKNIVSSLKLSISMSLIGVITGEFLVSKAGIGYLIIYGTQVFNLNLVISGIILLIIISYVLYMLVCLLEKILIKNK